MSGGYGGGAGAAQKPAAWWLGWDVGGNPSFDLDLPIDGQLIVEVIANQSVLDPAPRQYMGFVDGQQMYIWPTEEPGVAAAWWSDVAHPLAAGHHTFLVQQSDDGGTTWVPATLAVSSGQMAMLAWVGLSIWQPGT